jgi:hypothetical protein
VYCQPLDQLHISTVEGGGSAGYMSMDLADTLNWWLAVACDAVMGLVVLQKQGELLELQCAVG